MKKRFRSAAVRGFQYGGALLLDAQGPAAIDREAGVIRGASALQAVEALGHDILIDDVMLKQVADLGNAAPTGVLSRFTHPGLCSDGMGKALGRMRNFRIVGDKVLGDLHLLDAAAKSPDGDLRGYVLDLAAEDPTAFGMSISFAGYGIWKLADGSEIRSDDPSLLVPSDGWGGESYKRPDEATTELPFARCDELRAVDVVDEPAANRDGMFGGFAAAVSALSVGTNGAAAEAFTQLDRLRESLGWDLGQAQTFLARYFAARAPKPSAGAKPATPSRAEGSAMLTTKRLAELCKANPNHQDLILELGSADGADEAAVLRAVDDARVKLLSEKSEQLLVQIETERKAHADAIAKKDEALAAAVKERDDFKAKHDKLAALADGGVVDPGSSTGDALPKAVPKYSQAQARAGEIPTAVLESGNYQLVP